MYKKKHCLEALCGQDSETCHMSFVSRSGRSIDGCYPRVRGWRLSVVVMPVWKFVGKAERGTAPAASFVLEMKTKTT